MKVGDTQFDTTKWRRGCFLPSKPEIYRLLKSSGRFDFEQMSCLKLKKVSNEVVAAEMALLPSMKLRTAYTNLCS